MRGPAEGARSVRRVPAARCAAPGGRGGPYEAGRASGGADQRQREQRVHPGRDEFHAGAAGELAAHREGQQRPADGDVGVGGPVPAGSPGPASASTQGRTGWAGLRPVRPPTAARRAAALRHSPAASAHRPTGLVLRAGLRVASRWTLLPRRKRRARRPRAAVRRAVTRIGLLPCCGLRAPVPGAAAGLPEATDVGPGRPVAEPVTPGRASRPGVGGPRGWRGYAKRWFAEPLQGWRRTCSWAAATVRHMPVAAAGRRVAPSRTNFWLAPPWQFHRIRPVPAP